MELINGLSTSDQCLVADVMCSFDPSFPTARVVEQPLDGSGVKRQAALGGQWGADFKEHGRGSGDD